MPATTMSDTATQILPTPGSYALLGTGARAELGDIERWSRARTLAFIGISSTLLWACIGSAVALVW
jgi:hypothetical protein